MSEEMNAGVARYIAVGQQTLAEWLLKNVNQNLKWYEFLTGKWAV